MGLDIPSSAPVDMEAGRLTALVSTVFEDGHYHWKCGCSSCAETRRFLDYEDLNFINSVSKKMETCDHIPRSA